VTEQELKDYATDLILSYARDVEYLSIFEMAEEYIGGEISGEDARRVDDLMSKATITVEFPAVEAVSSDG
jgi:hypothetical protein